MDAIDQAELLSLQQKGGDEEMKVFISYAKEDQDIAKRVFADLKQAGLNPWLDCESLLPGQNWEEAVLNAISESSYFLALISSRSITKKGFVQTERKMALDMLDELSASEMFVIPVRLDECESTNRRLQKIHRVDLFPDYQKGVEQILRVLRHRKFSEEESNITIPLRDSLSAEQVEIPQNIPPKQYKSLIGRDSLIKQILQLLEEPDASKIIAIDGLGGIGKTALAREVVDAVIKDQTFSKVVWETAKTESFYGAQIHQHKERRSFNIKGLVTSIATQLGYAEEVRAQRTTASQLGLLRRLLSSNKCLIIIDNLETIREHRDLVGELHDVFAASRAILTTRHKVAEYDFVFSLSLQGLSEDGSIQFLKQEIETRGAAGRFEITEDNLRRIHRSTGGLPLAMKLIVGQLFSALTPLEELLHRLENVTAEPGEGLYNIYKFIYENNWKSLSESAGKLLIVMGTLPPLIGTPVEDILAISGLPRDEFFNTIKELNQFCLIERMGSAATPLYALHPMTAHFVRSDLI